MSAPRGTRPSAPYMQLTFAGIGGRVFDPSYSIDMFYALDVYLLASSVSLIQSCQAASALIGSMKGTHSLFLADEILTHYEPFFLLSFVRQHTF